MQPKGLCPPNSFDDLLLAEDTTQLCSEMRIATRDVGVMRPSSCFVMSVRSAMDEIVGGNV